MTIHYAGLSDRGCVRENNEDRWFADPALGMFLVSDGMGGRRAGELASRIVVEVLPRRLRRTLSRVGSQFAAHDIEPIARDVSELSHHLRRESEGQPGLAGMGATLVLALIKPSQALVVHLGDSRVYLLRAGQLEQLTKDHTVAQYLVDAHEISPQEGTVHPAANTLSRYVGMEGAAQPDSRLVDLQPNDRLLLCSDGLTGMVSDQELGSILAQERDPESVCRHLIDAALAAGGRDNVTAVVVAV